MLKYSKGMLGDSSVLSQDLSGLLDEAGVGSEFSLSSLSQSQFSTTGTSLGATSKAESTQQEPHKTSFFTNLGRYMDAPSLFNKTTSTGSIQKSNGPLGNGTPALLIQVVRLINELKAQLNDAQQNTERALQDVEKRIILSHQLEGKHSQQHLNSQVPSIIDVSLYGDAGQNQGKASAGTLADVCDSIVMRAVQQIEGALGSEIANAQDTFLEILMETFKDCIGHMTSSFEKTLSAFVMALPKALLAPKSTAEVLTHSSYNIPLDPQSDLAEHWMFPNEWLPSPEEWNLQPKTDGAVTFSGEHSWPMDAEAEFATIGTPSEPVDFLHDSFVVAAVEPLEGNVLSVRCWKNASFKIRIRLVRGRLPKQGHPHHHAHPRRANR